MEEKFYYASLFSSAGIGCYGFHNQGFECVLTSELHEKRIKIQKINQICKFEDGYLQGDIRQYDIIKKIRDNLKKVNKKTLDVLIATPPCQGISLANHKKNKNDIHRNSLITESVNCVKEIEPRIFIFENVQRFLKSACLDNNGKSKSIGSLIDENLQNKYNIYKRVINFKDFGSPSSRTRCLVIGVLKTERFSPLSIFPNRKNEKKLFDIIGKYPSLTKIGEISKSDIYHNFKGYDAEMRKWISGLKQGESAFDNKEDILKPHRVVNGKIVVNQNKNGDKYKRQFMNKVAPCIHTRNDIMASQNTVHPIDDRVFSIREVMDMMGLPDGFQWSEIPLKELNKLSESEKKIFLKRNEMNIRSCLGEAVPTPIFEEIATNIKKSFIIPNCKLKDFTNQVLDNNFIKTKSLFEIFAISEINNSQRFQNSAFYTPEKTVFELLMQIEMPKKKNIRILEPSVGSGNFIPFIFKFFSSYDCVELDVLDIDKNSLSILKKIINKIGIPSNFKINYVNQDFFNFKTKNRYDIIVGNPPYGIIHSENAKLYRKKYALNKKNRNIFCLFLEKSMNMGNQIAFIIPKSFLSSPQYQKTRNEIENKNILSIIDYGEHGFKGVKIETVALCFKNLKKKQNNSIFVKSINKDITLYQYQDYICDKNLPYWIIYRDSFFDTKLKKMKLGIFSVFRDRQILKKHVNYNKKGIPVYKSRNIGNKKIVPTDKDVYISNIERFQVAQKLNKKLVMVPNLSYKPRACWLPKNSIVDGSVALLEPINGEKISDDDLEYYQSKEFHNFYHIARNYGTRSLNIDKLSVLFFGVIK